MVRAAWGRRVGWYFTLAAAVSCGSATLGSHDGGTGGAGGGAGAAGTTGGGQAGAGGLAGVGGAAGGVAGASGGGPGGAGGTAGAAGSGQTAAPGSIRWARSASSVYLYGVAEGSVGVVVSGTLSGPANLGGSILAPVGATDVALAEYAPADGSHLFSTRFGGGSPGGTGTVYGHLDILDSSGTPIIQGTSGCDPAGAPACNQIDVGLGLMAPAGGSGGDGFVGRYSLSTGQASWVDRMLGPGNDLLVTSTRGPNDTIFTAGWFDQSTTLINGTNTATAKVLAGGGDRDIVITQLNDVSGQINMATTFADAAFEQPNAIAWTGTNIIAAGFFAGTMTAFGMPLVSNDFDLWVAKLMPDGTPVWAVSLGGAGPDKYPFAVVDSAGAIYIAATLSGTATFGAFNVGGAGGLDVVVAKLNNSDGSVAWATSFGSSGDDAPAGLAINQNGQLLVSATVAGPIKTGGAAFGQNDAALVSFTQAGSLSWAKVLGTTGSDAGSGVTASVDGSFYANLNLGANIGPTVDGVTIQGASAPTGLLVKVNP